VARGRKKGRSTGAGDDVNGALALDALGAICVAVVLFVAYAVYSSAGGAHAAGPWGADISAFLAGVFGAGKYIVPASLLAIVLFAFVVGWRENMARPLIFLIYINLFVSLFAGIREEGGYIGNSLNDAGRDYLGSFYPWLLIIAFIVLTSLFFRIPLFMWTMWAVGKAAKGFAAIPGLFLAKTTARPPKRGRAKANGRRAARKDEPPTISTIDEVAAAGAVGEHEAAVEAPPEPTVVTMPETPVSLAPPLPEEPAAPEPIKEPTFQPLESKKRKPTEEGVVFVEEDASHQLTFAFKGEVEDYKLPSLSMLADAPAVPTEKADLTQQARVIEETLAAFEIEAKVVHIQEGPRVTRFEFTIGPGINLSRIHNLADNFALDLAVPSVKIEAPVPGKSAIGIEVPNRASRLITLKSILSSPDAQASTSPLTVGLGMDIAGRPVIVQIDRMPHLLVAGATGSDKSVCLNAVIMSLLFRASPEVLRLILIDPKRVELSPFKELPHLVTPVVNEVREAQSALAWAVAEMNSRYRAFSQSGARNIAAYNQRRPIGERMPYVVIVVDELADLMMMAGKTIERLICRIAQLARATGIHLVIATQRPEVKVITGLIKANIPSRIAFATVSQVDSRTILDQPGAENLLGSGDMLYSPIGESRPFRVQGAYVSDAEITAVAEYIKEQREPDYVTGVLEYAPEEEEEEGEGGDIVDELYEEAKQIVLSERRASTSYLQRRLKIGYNRAARIMEALEREGIVSESDGVNPREIID
jgi:DNA segregation ATPase FtsK/SpoIIIE-like protein